MKCLFPVAGALFTIFVFSACTQPDLSERPPMPENLNRMQSGIINGIIDTTHDAVVTVLMAHYACSGTIVAKNGANLFVLTAAHCVSDEPPLYVLQGDDYNDPDYVYYVADYEAHPGYSGGDLDFAMIRATGAGSATPVIPAQTSPDGLSNGTQVRHVGYGLISYPNGDTTERHYILGNLSGVDSITIWYGQGSGGPCSGDSGGPQLSTGGTERVVGVTSYGDAQCASFGVSGRVSSVYTSFIQAFIDGSPIEMTCDECFSAATSGAGDCMTEVNNCFNNNDCDALLTCFNGCGSNQSCMQQCVNNHPTGYAIYLLIYECVCQDACPDECGDEDWCQDLLPLGEACTSSDECESDNCVDGVCCNGTCTGQCEACDVSGQLGNCIAVSGDPHGTRPDCADDGTVCGGTCNGSLRTACTYPGSSTECRSASCSNATATLAADCDGAGACPAIQTVNCDPFECDGDVCDGGCVSDAECDTNFYCDTDGLCKPMGDLGAGCSSYRHCLSAHCVDGVCCNSSCTMQCAACDVAGLLGTCSAVTGDPHGPRPACQTDGTICGGACNGVYIPACTYPGVGDQCRSPSCSNGTAVLPADCDGAGACPSEQTQSCAPYDCVGDQCGGCQIDNDCPDNQFCAGGVCTPQFGLGVSCGGDNQCLSDQCVDGVCCNSACALQCEACDVAGSLGTCGAVTGDPHGARPACLTDGSLCGGTCNGVTRNACTYPGVGDECRAASCSSALAVLPADCDGAGACPPEQTQSCAPNDCDGDVCDGGCQTDGDCPGDQYCAGGVCLDKLQQGASCGTDNQCLSTHCVDGACCNQTCDLQCEACDVTGSVGTCVPVTGVPHGVRPICLTDGSVCGGNCDGTQRDACAYPGGGTECRAASCADALAVLSADCDGAGACPPEQTQSCAPNECSGDICDGGCQTDDQCGDGLFCSAGVCVDQYPDGQVCAGSNQCLHDHCVDGVCCDDACLGQCEACDVSGYLGSCTPVTGLPHGARQLCATDGTVCAGTCNGILTDTCAYPGGETECRAPSCTNAVAVLAASCSGSGSCPAEQTQSCAPSECLGDICDGGCIEDDDCADGYFCSAGMCLQQFGTGHVCSTDGQCLTGSCADGVCCLGACDGQCEACDLSGAEGTCMAITGAPRGGRAACLGTGLCKASCDGVDRTSCSFPDQTVVCAEGSCVEGVESTEATCDGAGNCGEVLMKPCGAYACWGGVCLTTCNANDECAEGNVCKDGSCVAEGPDPGGDGCGCSAASTGNMPVWLGMGVFGLILAGLRRRRDD